MLSFSIICIFLSATLSVRGQAPEGGGAPAEALRWERVVFGSDDVQAVQEALYKKAVCLAGASMFEEAIQTLDRIKMYLLDPDMATDIILLKSACHQGTGDAAGALGYLEESGLAGEQPELYAVLLAGTGRYQEALEWSLACAGDDEEKVRGVKALFAKAPRTKTEGKAAALSFLPPLGQLYLGKPAEGLLSLGLNAGAAGFTLWQLLGHNWVTGILGGGLMLNETFFKANMGRNLSTVDRVNSENAASFASNLNSLLASFKE